MAGLTEEQKKARWADFVQWYQTNVSAGPGGPQRKKIPAELKKLYMSNNGAWGTDRAMMWIRLHDPNYLLTPMAQERLNAIKGLYEKALGYKINWRDRKMRRFANMFARANPNKNVDRRLTEIFMKRIMPSKEFKTRNPGFASWLNKNRDKYSDATTIIAALTDYNAHKESLQDFWESKSTLPMPKELLDMAIANDWQTDNAQFLQAMASTREWAAGAGYDQRSKEFDQNWKSIFGDGTPIDAGMRDAYSRDMSGLTFSDFFHSKLKNSDVFKQSMPGYADWEASQHRAGQPEGSVDIFDYFTRRSEFMEMWNENFTGGEIPDSTFIDQALKENWGNATFQNKLRALPQYELTGAGADRAAKFDQYWKGLFGENAVPDPTLRSRYIGSEATDPSMYWDDIKKTDSFKKMFSNWDVFSQAQSSAGHNVIGDPEAYKQYREDFTRAFTDIGIEVPAGLDRTIFASGVSGEDLQRRAQDWRQSEVSVEAVTGQHSDLVQSLGVERNGRTAEKAAADAGAMRIRMQKALAQHRATIEQKAGGFEQSKSNSGLVTQKI